MKNFHHRRVHTGMDEYHQNTRIPPNTTMVLECHAIRVTALRKFRTPWVKAVHSRKYLLYKKYEFPYTLIYSCANSNSNYISSYYGNLFQKTRRTLQPLIGTTKKFKQYYTFLLVICLSTPFFPEHTNRVTCCCSWNHDNGSIVKKPLVNRVGSLSHCGYS